MKKQLAALAIGSLLGGTLATGAVRADDLGHEGLNPPMGALNEPKNPLPKPKAQEDELAPRIHKHRGKNAGDAPLPPDLPGHPHPELPNPR